jgi:DNA-binding response OmpR family regulator
MRILVVDDDRDIREFLKANLSAECFSVDTAGDGEEGSYLARTRTYDIIILDNVMPKKSGRDVCRDIRSNNISTPIIMISFRSEVEEKIDLLDKGADDYLGKPFSYKELRARMRAVLRRPKAIESSIVKVDDLTLDRASQKVKRGSKEIRLTRKEFAITEYMMRHSGLIVSRGMLMEHVWGDDIDPFSNTIESHILNIRKKIDKPPKRKLIYTISGRGYKIDCSP